MTPSSRVPFLDLRAAYRELETEIDAATKRVVQSGWYVLGREVEAFEAEFASYVGTRHCVGVASGTNAITLALLAAGIAAGDEVLVAAHTCTPTWLGITHARAVPVPVDVSPSTLTMDTNALSASISPRTRAIMPVHIYGQTCNMYEINSIARSQGLAVIEDAAQAHGASWNGRRAGTLGNAAAWSFYPTKNLGAVGDAGAVTTDDSGLAERVRSLRNYGWTERYSAGERGFNSRLDELQAAILRAKLPVLDEWNNRRSVIASSYLQALRNTDLALPQVAEGAIPSWHLFAVRTPPRDKLRQHLAAQGVQTLVHYPVAPHLQPAFADLGYLRGSLPVAESVADGVLSLPMGPHLEDDAVGRVIDAVHSFFSS